MARCSECKQELPRIHDEFCPYCREELRVEDEDDQFAPPTLDDPDRFVDARIQAEKEKAVRMLEAGTRMAVIRDRIHHRGFSETECEQIIRLASIHAAPRNSGYGTAMMVVGVIIALFGLSLFRLVIPASIVFVAGGLLFVLGLFLKVSTFK